MSKARQTVVLWDQKFPIGTKVIYEGEQHFTESHAGIGLKGEASVFISGVETPVPIGRLDVPGYTRTTGKRK